jgi:pyrroline-5-carboxylate reductase
LKKTLDKKVGFLGAGRMATALAQGLIRTGICRISDITASDVSPQQLMHFQKTTRANQCESNAEVVEASDVVVLAVKPGHVAEVLESIRSVFKKQLLISIAAGVPIAKLEGGLPAKARVVRVMPNTPALIGCGAAAFALGEKALPADADVTEAIFNAVGISFHVPESQLDAVTGLSGSGPAYIYHVIEALARGGTELGIDEDVALKLAAQTVRGAARMVLEGGKSPRELIEMVTSPGGTTVEGMAVLVEKEVHDGLVAAVKAAAKRSKELGKH